jgi:predicted YcjX-like family ATPase
MTLSEFLAALNNPQAVVTVFDDDNTELIKLYAAGYAQLLATLLAREVDKVTVVNQAAITVILKAA